MSVDKNLFLHDLAIVAIMKNEAPYLKEWLDYHLLAGVDHFYIYGNDSPDKQAEVVAPYVKAGLVDYFPAPGKIMQMLVYNDAIKRFKFQNRYMAFIDGDKFVYPKVDWGVCNIVDVVDEILSHNSNASGLAINWQCFGSNGQEKADFSRSVLERFTRRAPKDWNIPLKFNAEAQGNLHVKTIVNPRAVKFFVNPHFPIYFESKYSVNEHGDIVQGPYHLPVTADKIVINHYYTKSHEEFVTKRNRGRSDIPDNDVYGENLFHQYDRNEEFDDGILRYREERKKIYQPLDKSRTDEKFFNALAKNLSPTLLPNTPPQFYAGKMETFLTCRSVSSYLKIKLTDDVPAKFFEEASLKAILKSFGGINFADARLFICELPNLLSLTYPVVEEIRNAALKIIPQMMETMHLNRKWENFVELSYIQDLLRAKNF